jgi:hypothetical protein
MRRSDRSRVVAGGRKPEGSQVLDIQSVDAEIQLRQVRYDLGNCLLFRCRAPDHLLGRDIAQTPIELRWGGLLDTDGLLIAKIA